MTGILSRLLLLPYLLLLESTPPLPENGPDMAITVALEFIGSASVVSEIAACINGIPFDENNQATHTTINAMASAVFT